MYEQLSFIKKQYIKDTECNKNTPIMHGMPDEAIYGKGVRIIPSIPGRTDSQHFQDIYLKELLPLEDYDLFIILLSGGKDSIACYYKLIELGVPKSKIEFWHHDIDGKNPERHMDWRCTQNYVRAFAKAENIPLRVSYRKGGFFKELYRVGASEEIEWEDPDTNETLKCKPTANFLKCKEIIMQATKDMHDQLKKFGFRMKFPAKSGDLSRRWCSSYLKISVADAVMSNLYRLVKEGNHKGKRISHIFHSGKSQTDCKILIISGERRGESTGRSKYNEMEIHRTNAEKKLHRIVHQWRPVIDYSEKDVWEVLKRHNVNPHPCYRAGWPRCSCAMCIFSTPRLFAGIREIYPDEYELLKQDEINLGFTLDNKYSLNEFVGDAKSCVYWDDKSAIHSLLTGEFTVDDVYVKGQWMYPAGAFHGAEGGPC